MAERIPKIIHYCWLSNDPYPEMIQKCIDSWKQAMPDYQFMKWDTTNFDVNMCNYTRQAFDIKKYTYASDYIRLYALYHYGGIYLDADIKVVKNFEPLLDNEAFTCFESETSVAAWIFGSSKGNPIFKEFLDYYKDRDFILPNGQFDSTPNPVPITATCVEHGLELNHNVKQVLDHITVYPMSYFCPYNPYRSGGDCYSDDTYAIHLFNGAWIDDETKEIMLYTKKYKDKLGEKLGGHLGAFIYRLKHEGFFKTVAIYRDKARNNAK